jgi:hypothetical protein
MKWDDDHLQRMDVDELEHYLAEARKDLKRTISAGPMMMLFIAGIAVVGAVILLGGGDIYEAATGFIVITALAGAMVWQRRSNEAYVWKLESQIAQRKKGAAA